MKKIFSVFVSFSLLLTSVVSCSNETFEKTADDVKYDVKIRPTVKDFCTISNLSRGNQDGRVYLGLFASLTEGGDVFAENNKYIGKPEDNLYTAERRLFFPDIDKKVDITIYHPYSRSDSYGEISTSIKQNQNDNVAFKESDFLIGTNKGVLPTDKPVDVEMSHKFIKLEFLVTGEKLKDYNSSDIRILVQNTYTNAEYNFIEDKFSDFSGRKIITPNGEWKKTNNGYSGKKVILIPVEGESYEFAVEVGNNTFVSRLDTQANKLKPGFKYVVEVDIDRAVDIELSRIIGSQREWDEGEDQSSELYKPNYVVPRSLSFQPSGIYLVYDEATPIYALCREFLQKDELKKTVITAYPTNKDKSIDMNRGVILFADGDIDLEGREIQWDERYSFSIGEQNNEVNSNIYFDKDRMLCFDKPESPLNVKLRPYKYVDIRGPETKEYGLVKLGKVIWLNRNLETRKYLDGSDILDISSKYNSETSGYIYNSKTRTYYYDSELIDSGKLIPNNLRIPSADEGVNMITDYLLNETTPIINKEKIGDDGLEYIKHNATGLDFLITGYYDYKDRKQLNEVDMSVSCCFRDNQNYTFCIHDTNETPIEKAYHGKVLVYDKKKRCEILPIRLIVDQESLIRNH